MTDFVYVASWRGARCAQRDTHSSGLRLIDMFALHYRLGLQQFAELLIGKLCRLYLVSTIVDKRQLSSEAKSQCSATHECLFFYYNSSRVTA